MIKLKCILQPQKIQNRELAGYFSYAVGQCLSFGLVGSFILYFYTDILGISPAAAGAMLKCDGCRDRVAEGKKPVCVEACPLRALDFLPIDALRKKYGSLSEVAPLKPAHLTRPALSIMPGKRKHLPRFPASRCQVQP